MRFERFWLYAIGVKSPWMYKFFILASWSSFAFCRSRRGLMIFPWRTCLIFISFEICSSFIPRRKAHKFDLALKTSAILLCQPNKTVLFMIAYHGSSCECMKVPSRSLLVLWSSRWNTFNLVRFDIQVFVKYATNWISVAIGIVSLCKA